MTIESSLKILTDCHVQMADRLSLLTRVVLDETDDVLFDMVKNSGSSEHSVYFEAMREIRRKRTLIESGFRDKYIGNYEINIRDVQSGAIAGSGPDADHGISKKSAADTNEEILAVDTTINRIRRNCGAALFSLEKNIASLPDNARVIRKEFYPASPEIICTAFHEACKVIDAKIEVRLILLKVFERIVIDKIQEIYVDLGALMKKKTMAENAPVGKTDKRDDLKAVEKAPAEQQNDYFIKATGEVRKQINLHLGKAIVPDFINDLLFNHWSKLLLKIYLRGGLESKNWLNAIEVVDDLVECVGNEASTATRKEYSAKIPYLVQRLKNGMNAISVSPTVQNDLVNRLVDLHQELIKHRTETESFDEEVTLPRFTQKNSDMPFFNELLVDKKKH